MVELSLVGGPQDGELVESQSEEVYVHEGHAYYPTKVPDVFVYGGPEGEESQSRELRVGEGFRKILPDSLRMERYESLVQELKGFALEAAQEEPSIINSAWEDTIATFDEEEGSDDKIVVLRAFLSLPAKYEEGVEDV